MSRDDSLRVLFVQTSEACTINVLINGFPLMKDRHLFAGQEWTELIDLHNVTSGNYVELSWRGADAKSAAPSIKCLVHYYPEGGTVTTEHGAGVPLESDAGIAERISVNALRFSPKTPVGTAEFRFEIPGHDFKSVYYGAEFISEDEALRSARTLLSWARDSRIEKMIAAYRGFFSDLARINGLDISEIEASFREIFQDVNVEPTQQDDGLVATSYCGGRLVELSFGAEPLLKSTGAENEVSLDVFFGRRSGRITVLR